MNIQLLLTGNELMTGDIVDSNSAMIAQQLLELGITVSKKVTVGDNLEALVEQLRQQAQQADVLLVNGGLGPTCDDLTAEALARLTNSELVEHPDALSHLRQWCENRGTALNKANHKQAMLPQGAQIIPNHCGSAVGIKVHYGNCEILCTPGVPSELKAMMEQTLIDAIRQKIDPSQSMLLHRIHTFGLGESGLQQWISDQLPGWPEIVGLGFRAGSPSLEIKLQTPVHAAAEHQLWIQKLQQLIGNYIVAEGHGSLNQSLVNLLKQQGKTLTTAESCTGGLIASKITEIPGSSAVFEAGYVTYSNTIKSQMLGVEKQVIDDHGAVSEAVVRQMAEGALKNSGADYVIAVSGVAGPDGGTADKPVGLVWLAWGDSDEIKAATLFFPYGRKTFQTMTAGAGMDLIRRHIQGIEEVPRYLKERQSPKTGQ
ncbi:MAG: CinA family nicotinamide mononucleotide deamidase-related protein [Motiliproteus sp.]